MRERSMNGIESLDEITRGVFINMPLRDIGEHMSLIEKYPFNLEIGMDYYSIDNLSSKIIRKTAERLKGSGISMTVHAPYNEIFLGAPDRMIRDASLLRMESAFELIPWFSPLAVVIHLNYEERRFGFIYDEWFSMIIPALKRYAERCGDMGAFLAIENVYEESPDAMASVLEALDGYPAYHCLDVGHLNAFSDTGIDEWIEKMGRYITHFHLHDNDGSEDSHSPIGSGNIDFKLVGDFISTMEKRPLITLEPHNEKDLWATLSGFKRMGLVDVLNGFYEEGR
jgi:sugar phosphate isomerase/epimerase